MDSSTAVFGLLLLLSLCERQLNAASAQTPIRLVDGDNECTGRVEIYHVGLWGTVCDYSWNLNNAEVVCRQAGCGRALAALSSAHFGAGSGPIWLGDVRCSGKESSLTQCQHHGFGSNFCSHHGDVGVICSAIRLVNGSDQCSGRVEIYHVGQWGTVCDSSWNLNNTEVVCRQAGCGRALDALSSAHFGQGSGPIWLGDVSCSGNESSLTQCQHPGFGSYNCSHHEDAGVNCSVNLQTQIRLINGDNECSGRVEIYHVGQWGTVCDYSWNMNDAEVVCRQAGCGRALAALSSAHFGAGSGPIWLGDVRCSGNESSLTQCQHPGFGSNFCSHYSDVGVICSAIRLVNGSDRCSGRVEIYHVGQWGTVCDNSWNMNDAEVVCRQAGCGRALDALSSAHFGQGSGPIWLGDVRCSGNESSLTQCQHPGFGSYNCSHHEDAGVNCSVNLQTQIRLINGDNECSGRVEIYHVGQWGTVCDYSWNMNDAEVVCRQAGCGRALAALSSAHFGAGSGPIWLGDVRCSGNESSLTQCQHPGFGSNFCSHYSDVGVICSAIRLVNGSDRCSGRVEIYHVGQWGTVCDNSWNMNDAEVVCRQAGCGRALDALSSAHFGQGSGPIWLGDVRCSGNESSLTQCQHPGFGSYNCSHHEDAGVNCSVNLQTQIRLVNGDNECSGRVEIYHVGQWGTVCDYSWNMNDAEVVCRQAGCGRALAALSSAHFGAGSGPIWLGDVRCSGNESSLTQCQHPGFGSNFCSHYSDVGVICSAIRLVNGSDRCSGRVEIYHVGQWGTVCDNSWNMNDAEVVCRQAGCGRALDALSSAHFGQGSGPIWLGDVRCSGNESSLTQCQHPGFGSYNCSHHEDAGVNCSVNLQTQIRLVNGDNECSGRVEIYHVGQWGTVCDYSWNMDNAEVVCRQAGCGRALAALSRAHFGQGSGLIWLGDVSCSGNESSLTQCQHPGFGSHFCSHSTDVGVICSAIRLVNGSDRCSGRVEIYHVGQWGTVCDNSWNMNDAEVVCRQAGCGRALDALSSAHFGQGSGPIWLGDVSCSGNESSLTQCQHPGFGSYNCSHHEDAGVNCSVNLQTQIRLVNGDNECSGRVEIYHVGQWGTVCDYSWNMDNAEVVCRQAGCGRALAALSRAHFGQGSGLIWLGDVSCSGNESSLTQCQHPGFGSHFCSHSTDVGVICSAIRLVNGSDRCSGRVEIYHVGQWGTVCDNSWNMNDAEVVCRQAGCGRALDALSSAHFGQGSGPIWLGDVSCSGNESSLTQCQHPGFGSYNCSHHEDAGVNCSVNLQTQIRLVNGDNECSGRVEIYHVGQWGTVCDYSWNMDNAEVVCRQAGCGRALAALSRVHFGQGSGLIWLGDVSCSGNESSLTQCQHPGFGSHFCSHSTDVGVICSAIRLVNGSDRCSGRVEIYHVGQWGTVCDNSWNMNDAEVVCRQAGCGRALDALSSAHFGQGSGPIWLGDVSCSGNESSLTQCQHPGFGSYNCSHHEDAGVNCSVNLQTQIRLVNGDNQCSGRVEIYHVGLWGTVCDYSWNMNDAQVVCRQAGCGRALAALSTAHFGAGSGPIWLGDVSCSGNESSLTQCQHRGFGSNFCSHYSDVGVICSAIRLVNGSDRCSGRVEIYHVGQWGTVCDNSWNMNDAEVVCRQAGCGRALDALSSAHFGQGSGPIWLGDVRCSGNESSLTQCQHPGFGSYNCSHHEDAGVNCSVNLQTQIRLVNGDNECSGRVEIYHVGQWGTVCDYSWNMNDAEVVCRQAGCGRALATVGSAHFGQGSGLIWLNDALCSGNESSLTQCQHPGFRSNFCPHSTDIGVICSVLTAETVISQLKVSLLIPSSTGDQEVEAALYNASLALEAYLKNKFSAINSFRIRKFIKP